MQRQRSPGPDHAAMIRELTSVFLPIELAGMFHDEAERRAEEALAQAGAMMTTRGHDLASGRHKHWLDAASAWERMFP